MIIADFWYVIIIVHAVEKCQVIFQMIIVNEFLNVRRRNAFICHLRIMYFHFSYSAWAQVVNSPILSINFF